MPRIAAPPATPVALAPGSAPSALLAELPPTLRNLALGAFLSGTVLERSSSGLTLLKTHAGVLGLKTTVPLPPGSAVTLQVQSAGAQLQAIVLSVTPQPPSAKAQVPAPTAPQGTAASPPAPVPADGRMGAPSTISATVIGPAGGPPPQESAQPRAQPAGPPASTGAPPASASPQPSSSGVATAPPSPSVPAATPDASPAIVKAATRPLPTAGPVVNPPTAAGAPAPPSPVGGAPTAPPSALPASSPAQSAGTAPSPLPSGTQIQLRLLPGDAPPPAVPPTAGPKPQESFAAANSGRGVPVTSAPPPPAPGTAAPTSGSAAPSAALIATVVARTPAGQTILDTALGRLLVRLPRAADATPAGGSLHLELVTIERADGARPALPSGPSILAREWPGLKDALHLLRGTAEPGAQAALDRAVPKPGPQFAQQILAFIAAGAQGGIRAWLGEAAARTLERLAAGSVVRLDRDIGDMLPAHSTDDANWHLTVVPFVDGRDLRQLRFFERRKKADRPGRRSDDIARFVVECEHSELGALQLDGLVHERRLDLILRSHDPLPAGMEHDILLLFGQTCAGLGVNGQIAFQATPVFPVNPLDEFSSSAVRVSV